MRRDTYDQRRLVSGRSHGEGREPQPTIQPVKGRGKVEEHIQRRPAKLVGVEATNKKRTYIGDHQGGGHIHTLNVRQVSIFVRQQVEQQGQGHAHTSNTTQTCTASVEQQGQLREAARERGTHTGVYQAI